MVTIEQLFINGKPNETTFLTDYINFLVKTKGKHNKLTVESYTRAVACYIKTHNFSSLWNINTMARHIAINPRQWHLKYAFKYVLEMLFGDVVGSQFFKKLPKMQKLSRRVIKKSVPFNYLKHLVARARDTRIKALLILEYETGLRIGSLLGLRIENVSYDESTHAMKVTVLEKGGMILTRYVSKFSQQLVEQLMRGRTTGLLIQIPFKHKDAWFWRQLKKLAREVPSFSSHWTRVSRGIHLFDRGHDPLTIKNLFAHKYWDTTFIYLQEAGTESKKLMKTETPIWSDNVQPRIIADTQQKTKK